MPDEEKKVEQGSMECQPHIMRRALNINDYVWVKLKEAGYKHWMEKYNRFLPFEQRQSMSFFKDAEKDGYVKFQLWDFMEIFGDGICFGSPPIFETTIEFLEKDLQPVA